MRGAAALLRWLLVALTLTGFLGQLSLQSQGMAGETPRRTLLRLTGIDIAPAAPAAMPMAHMHGMSMTGMARHHHENGGGPHDDGSCPLCPLLHLPLAALDGGIAAPLALMTVIGLRARPNQPRAPPVLWSAVASPRGPPAGRLFPGRPVPVTI